MPEHVQRDLPVRVAQGPLLLAGEAEIGDAASLDVGEHGIEGDGVPSHLGATAGAAAHCPLWLTYD